MLENEDSTSNINATYKPESSNIFGHSPATISYTDFILAKDDQEFIYKLQLDDNQATENSQINIDFYQAKEEGYVVNKTYSQNIPFTKELKLQIPSGQIAKINFTSTVKENANPQNFTFNNKTIANPDYKTTASKEEESIDNSFNNEAGAKSSNNSIAQDNDQDFSANPNTKKAELSTDNSFNKDAGANSSNDSITDDKDQDFSTNPNTEKAGTSTDSSFNKDAGAKSSNDSIAHNEDQDFSKNSNTKKEDSTKAESSNNETRANSPTDIIADDKNLDFSSNSKIEDKVSAIAINKDGYLAKLNNESRLTNELKEAINDITSVLEAYNNDEIYLDELQASIGKTASEYNLESSQIEEIIKALISGLNEKKHKVATLNVSDIGKAIAGNDGKRNVEKALAGPDANIPSDYLDRLVNEKLQEEGITIEDFQNYMYELEEKYGLSNEDVDRIYTENEDTIKNLISKAQEEKTTGDVFAADNQSAFRKTYPYKTNYWTYQYYKDGKVNWDIRIETDQIKPSHLEFDNVGLSLYAPAAQGLTNFKVTVKDNLSDVSTNDNAKKVRERSGNGTTTFADRTLEKDGNLYKFNLNIPKEKLPNDLIIHVEATPKDDHAKYQMYDLGLRLTPDNNYINDKVKEFKEDWARLVSLMPWILPYKSGESAAERFADGINLVDTRLPADAMVAAYKDDHYKAKSYTDKSRSVFGEFVGTNTNNVRWQISDTLRLQDDDRFVSSGKLGDDVFNKSFNANNSSGHANPNIEVLEPKSDGKYTRIFSTSAPNNPSGSEDFRNKLSNVRPVLLPGTIINYTFNNRPANKPSEDSIVTINFSDRFDDGVGSYGGDQTATLRKLSPNEIVDNEKYRVVYAEYKSGDIKNEPNRIDAMIIKSTGDIVYCLNATLPSPAAKEIAKDVLHSTKYEDISGTKLNELISRKTSSQDALVRRLKAIFYTAEYEYKFNSIYISANEWGPDKTKYNAVQAAIYRAIDDYNNGIGLNTAEEMSYYRGFANGDPNKVFERGIKPTVDSFYNKVKEVEGRLGADLDNLVRLDGYQSVMDTAKKAQNIIGPVFTSPFEMDKVDKDDNKLSGIEFNIVDSSGAIVKKWTSSEKTEKIYLKPGVYTLKEVDSKTYRAIKDVQFEIKEEKVQVNKYDYIDYSNNQKGQVTNYKNQLKLALLENDNKDSTFGQLVTLDTDAIKIKVKNIEDTQLEINKKLLAADGEYHELAGIKFTLKENGTLNWTKKEATTNSKGIAVFDNLPLNSEWTLEEVGSEGISQVYTTWNVKVDTNGKVTITGNKDSKDPDNLFTIDPSDSSKITVINEPDIKGLGKFKIKKVDQAGNPLGNAGFTLYKSDKTTVVKSSGSNKEEYFTDENGNLYYSNIPDGIYYLKETTPPEGYTRASTSEWTSISIRNSNINIVDGDISPDQIDQYLRFGNQGETVSVKSIDGEESSPVVDENGNVNISNLDDGQYELSQNNNKITVHIKDGKLTRSYQGGFVTNNPDQPSTNDQSLVQVSAELTQALVRYPNDYKSYAYPSNGYIDVSRWANGTYKIEDEIAKELITIEVKDGKLAKSPIRSDLYETVTTRNWKSDLDYQKDANYPDYMNMKDYVELTDYDSGELTSYILLKPDNKISGGNGTDKDTIFNIMASNANIKSVEIFDIGGDYYKAGPNASMDDQSMGSYISDYNMQGTNETRDRKDKTYITIDGQRRGSVYNTYSNSVKISIPASRFGKDWSYLIRVKSNIYNKDYESIISHHWVTDNDTPGEAYLKKDFDVPAYKDLTETRKVANIIEDSKNLATNVINNLKEGFLGSLVQTAYAAETSDFSKVEISHTPNGASDYIEYTVVNVIDNVDVSFTKYGITKDSNGQEYSQILPGAEFKLQRLENNQFVDTGKTVISDSNGQISFEDLSTGEYQIIETKVSSDAYRLPDGAVKTFKVEAGKVYIKTANGYEEYEDNKNDYIYNEKKGRGKLRIHKVDDHGDNLAGVEFTLFKFDPTNPDNAIDIVNTAITDNDGYAVWEDLPYGKYWIKETKARPGYILDTEKKLVNITKDYSVPDETNTRDISNSISIDQSYVYSTEGNLYQVYPNYGQGLVANLTLDIQTKVYPGDQFTLRLSDNLDLDGVGNVSDGSDGKYDIIGSDGTIAKASIENDRKTITYTFTNAVENKSVSSLRLIAPMYPNRLLVQNDTTPQFNISIGQSSFTKDDMTVYYSHYQQDNTKPFLNAYTYKLDPITNKFTVIAYVNSNRVYSKNKQYLFEANAPVKIDSFETYRSSNNNLLPASYGIDFSNPGQYGLTYLGDRYNYNNANQYWVELEANNNYTYVIKIEGTIQSSTPTAFETQSYLTHTYDNCCWDTYTANTWSRFYDPSACGDTSTDKPEPTEQMLEFVNKENAIEFTKVDESEDPLQGGKFKLVKDGKDYGEIQTSDAQGKFGWTKLEEGVYQVIETDAPRGYTKPQDPVSSFEVNENGEIINIKDNTTTIKNYKASLPITGGPGSFIGFALLGTAVMLTALAYFGFYQMRSIPFKRRSIYR